MSWGESQVFFMATINKNYGVSAKKNQPRRTDLKHHSSESLGPQMKLPEMSLV